MIEGHYSTKYDVLLTQLSDEALMMGRLVEKQLRFAINALVYGDRLLAQQVEKTEDQVNRMEVEIDAKCIRLLATRQPKASDLRFVLMVIKTVNDLERMGDEVKSLELIRQDKKVDKKFTTTLKRIRKWMMTAPDTVPDAVDILWAIRSLERVGDRSCNICEHVIFFVKGEDIRHLNIDDIAD